MKRSFIYKECYNEVDRKGTKVLRLFGFLKNKIVKIHML